jgi:uncharacterized membrane protein YidH (DUF202 family)
MALALKALKITVATNNATFSVALVDGAEPAALQQAVAARTCCTPNAFFLTPASRDGVVVPLSSALPDGLELTLHFMQSGPTERKRQSRLQNMFEIANFSDEEDLRAQPGLESSTASDFKKEDPSSPIAKVAHTVIEPILEHDKNVGSSRWNSSLSWAAISCHSCDSPRLAGERDHLLRDDETMLTAMERFSRLTTDLANERTMLAWVRTCMASIRTAFAFLKVAGETPGWAATVFLAQSAMVTLMLVLCWTGYLRYTAIKHAVKRKLPPHFFGRISVRYMYALLFVSTAAIALGMYTKHWIA